MTASPSISLQAHVALVSAMILLSIALAGCSGRAGGVNIWDAVRADDAAGVERYAQAGGNLNVQALNGTTPLFLALSDGKRRAYERLLQLGADPNIIGSEGRVVVNYAAGTEDPFWLRLALKRGGDPNLLNVGASMHRKGRPITFAIATGSFENIKLLVEHGADVDVPDDFGQTPLMDAMRSARFDVVLYLLEQGADPMISVPGAKPYASFVDVVRSRRLDWFRKPDQRKQLEEIRAWLEAKGIDLSR